MKKGLCFVCHQFGHCASDHNNKINMKKQSLSPQKLRTTRKEAYTCMRGILAKLDDEEREKAVTEMLEQGFSTEEQ